MDIQQQIEQKLMADLDPVHLDLIDESHQHNVPQGAQSHFKATIVSAQFSGMSRIDRHRKVYRTLRVELDGMIKAFSVHTFAPEEWEGKETRLPDSPPCMGGGRDSTSLASD